MEWKNKTLEEIENLIANYEHVGKKTHPIYLEALQEREIRKGGGLDFKKSFDIIRSAAEKGRFVSYKDLADASGVEWTKVHYSIGPHLGKLIVYCYGKGWPPLSAIVVNKQHVATGDMEESALHGFLSGVESVGYSVDGNGEAALRVFQRQVFEWAKGL
jgi:hypothetical protein